MDGTASTSKEDASESGTLLDQPKESLVQILLTLGFTREEAGEGLLCTGNNDADMAASWILENRESMQTARVLDVVFEQEQMGSLFDCVDMYKMVIAVNSELKMGQGKMASQVAHACLGVYKEMVQTIDKYSKMLFAWQQYGETIVVVKVDKTVNLLELRDQAETLSLPHYLVQDAGLTQVAPGSATVLGIFGKVSDVDQVTGDLQLM
ncbi:PTH2 [Acanthosepion pharaonis]|uniref:peptidyl-tRNA hydrolase n=1 Tax=Acanthosepion pharaonis TaxID=158019 RepID=A0A812BWR7_ACAPH|nr:PTH2 [Sepia pharaonis]